MITNTPIDKESFLLTQKGQEVQSLLDLIEDLSEKGYSELQELIDVITNWDEDDNGESFEKQLKSILFNFLDKREVLPEILKQGETYQTEINGDSVSLGSDMPVQSAALWSALANCGIKQLPSGSTWYRDGEYLGGYRVVFGSQTTPSDDGLYLFSDINGTNATKRLITELYLTDKNNETFGGHVVLLPNTVAIISVTHDSDPKIIFQAQPCGEYLDQKFVNKLPVQTLSSEFSQSSDPQFTASNKSSVSLTTVDTYHCQQILATGNSTSSYYSTALFDFSQLISNTTKYITIEFDSKIPSPRWYISVVNNNKRPGSSSSADFATTGVAYTQGVDATGVYMINGDQVNTGAFPEANDWVHTKVIIDMDKKTAESYIQSGDNSTGKSDLFRDIGSDTNYINAIELYTWVTGNTMYFANLTITVADNTTNENTRYVVQAGENTGEYAFTDGEFYRIGGSSGGEIPDGSITIDKCDFYPYTYENYYGDLNSRLKTGLCIISNTSSSTASQYHYPKKGDTQYVGGFMYTAALSDSFVSQIFIPTNVDAPTIAYRLMRKGGGSYIISDWKFADGVNGNYVVSNTEQSFDSDLNGYTQNGFYSIAANTADGAECHMPSYNGVYWESGVLVVGQYEEGCTQLFLNWAVDNDDTGMYIPAFAIRTLTKHEDDYEVSSDWKVIDVNKANETYLDELSLSDYVDRGTGAYTVFGGFPERMLNALFVLKNDVSDYVSSKIYIDDETGYTIDTTIQPNISYLAAVTKQAKTGADHTDGTIHIYGAFDNGTSDSGSNLQKYSKTPQQIGTWIDGTPVWRVAFDRDLEEVEKSDKYVGFQSIVGDVVNNINKAFVIHAFASTRLDDTPCVVDDYSTKIDGNSFTIEGSDQKGIYGYIDFVTAESNIK